MFKKMIHDPVRSLVWMLMAGMVLATVLATLLAGPYAWDDGAITVAFARTLGETGIFALTGVSDPVEGSSSLLYVLVMSLIFAFVDMNFDYQILTSQLLSLSFLVAALAVLENKLREYDLTFSQRIMLIGLFFLLPMHLAELQNGMEMAALSFLILSFVVLYERGSLFAFALIPFLLLVRFESVFYLCFAMFFLFIFDKTGRQRHTHALIITLVLFSVLTFFRWLYFGDVMPNTIWAKLNPPYSTDISFLASIRSKWQGVVQFGQVNAPFLIMTIAFFLLLPNREILRDLKFWIVLAFIAFALLTGTNGGYPGRMFVGVLPILLLVCIEQVWAIRKLGIFNNDMKAARIIFSVAAAALIMTIVINHSLIKRSVTIATYGAYQKGLLFGFLDRQAQGLADNLIAYPENFRQTGLLVDKIRQRLEMDTLVFLAPDIGGLGLCCDMSSLRLLDSALLANQELARDGYEAFGTYMADNRPDILVTHAMWSEASGIYNLDVLPRQYNPVIFENTLFWIRKDHVDTLKIQSDIVFNDVTDTAVLKSLRNDLRENDLNYLNVFQGSPLQLMAGPPNSWQ